MKNLTLMGLLIMVVSILLLMYANRKLRNEVRRNRENVETLQEGIVRYRTSDSLNAISVGRLTLTKREMKEREADLLNQVEKLNIKVRRLNAVLETHSEAKAEIITILKDSVINDTTVLKCLKYNDNYFSIDACIHKDTLQGSLRYTDTLIQVLHRIPRKFWFIRWGTKAVKQDAYFANPNAVINYSRYIELKK